MAPALGRFGTGARLPGLGDERDLVVRQLGEEVAVARRMDHDLLAGERPQALVPAGAWQAAESLGDWTLVGCTVAPGFEFAGFELAPRGWEPG